MSPTDFVLAVPTLLLTAVAIAVLYVDKGTDSSFSKVTWSALGSLVVVLAVLAVGMGLNVEGYAFSETVFVDLIGYLLAIGATLATLITLVGAKAHIEGWKTRTSFVSLVLLTLMGTIFISFAANVLVIVSSWAIASAASYAIAMIRKDYSSADAGIKYLVMGLVSSSLMIFGFSLYVLSSGFDFSLFINDPVLPLFVLGSFFLIVAFSFKIGAFPFQAWLPDVYANADRVTVTFISSTSKVIGIAALLRVFEFVNITYPYKLYLFLAFAVISVGSMFVGNVTAFSRRDLPSILAFSSVTQAGFLMIGFAMLFFQPKIAEIGISVQTLGYVIAQAGIFLFINLIDKSVGDTSLSSLNGLSTSDRPLALGVSLLVLSLLGIPPLIGFWGKLFLFESSFVQPWLLVLGVINSAISAGYYIPIVREMFKPGNLKLPESPERDGVVMAAVLTVAVGFIAPLLFLLVV
ncbi:NADH-quinone oxidoreductase subunit N [Sulfodiicoccus acidiphilus]|uniref:NADH-quinone oxidoreductase subunit N n=1 Tax=Sulfodiicoccus acidiphilus TaxID=1670455 RepID=A0A348B0X2_9CREN|nr:NADH-quinone oxidoreductase subunit NuoN [Sulfodiicoccus acidiphilus]BBD71824.1 NADH-quinone oxidoreductase subunit N [Sulfodiicoccus acidiphilus]GGT99414.1 NADH-quinone oxidoreductase subunit N [Sulfodiicoccus acidiphilus]